MGDMNGPDVDVAQLVQRIRAEVERRRSRRATLPVPADSDLQDIFVEGVDASNSAHPIKLSLALPVPAPVQLTLPEPDGIAQPAFRPMASGRYHLKDLLTYHDREFIYAAYWAVLQRAPDELGLKTYLRLLRGGTPKVEILGFLRDSPEGQKVTVQVLGLSVHLSILRICQWPVVGPLVRFIYAFS